MCPACAVGDFSLEFGERLCDPCYRRRLLAVQGTRESTANSRTAAYFAEIRNAQDQ